MIARLGERYRLGERLATGGRGSVCRAVDESLGSTNHVAPGQATGDDVGPAADQYSLGCVLFEAVCGQTPHGCANPVAIATQHVSAPVPDPRLHRPDLRVPAAHLIRQTMARELGDRFASASAMAGTLVGMTSLLLALRPHCGHPEPPAGQPERPLHPQPTVDNGDEDD